MASLNASQTENASFWPPFAIPSIIDGSQQEEKDRKREEGEREEGGGGGGNDEGEARGDEEEAWRVINFFLRLANRSHCLS